MRGGWDRDAGCWGWLLDRGEFAFNLGEVLV